MLNATEIPWSMTRFAIQPTPACPETVVCAEHRNAGTEAFRQSDCIVVSCKACERPLFKVMLNSVLICRK